LKLYNGKWISDKVICQLLQDHRSLCKIDESYINYTSLCRAFGRVELSHLSQLHTPNNSGVYYRSAQNKRNGWTNIKECYIYFTTKTNCIPPLKGSTWLSSAVISKSQLLHRRSVHTSKNHILPPVAPPIVVSPKKDQFPVVSCMLDDKENEKVDECIISMNEYVTLLEKLRMESRLDSPEALELFAGSTVVQGLKEKTRQYKSDRIQHLQSY
jgi:hypothetical protein